MTYQEIYNMVSAAGVPASYFKFPDKDVPEPPFIVFSYPETAPESADNINYCTIVHLTVSLYTANKDVLTEATLEEVFNNYHFVYIKSESYIFTDDMYEVSYEGDVIING